MTLLTERYAKHIRGQVCCFDRIIVTGMLPDIGHPQAMTRRLCAMNLRIFDYTQFAEPLRDQIRANAETLARQAGLEIEFVSSVHGYRKEARVAEIVAERGAHPGLVHILSAMEPCAAYKPWHNKTTGETYLKYTDGKCLHYYFYFIDAEFGLCYMRVPTWAPFRLQFYCNGHNWLALRLKEAGIAFTQADNTFHQIADFSRAQALSDEFSPEHLHRLLDHAAARYCPVVEQFPSGYHWSLMQVEFSSDLVFDRQEALGPLYETLSRTAIHAVKADNVATFLGRKLHPAYTDEVGNDFHTRIEGTRIKHHMGPVSLKMYDKHKLVLRIETTVNDVTFFKHHRKVEHRNGPSEVKLAPVRKTIYSLPVIRELLLAANRRYLEFLSELADPSAGLTDVERLAEPVRRNDRTYRGFNLFAGPDLALLLAVVRGEFCISGFTNGALRKLLPTATGAQMSRLIKRMRLHGLVRKVGKTYKYYLTKLGKRTVTAALKLRELVVIPSLAEGCPA